ncbi:MAG: hypothetical protein JETCAE03_36170 [Ignavibacteriaceae bacterium]|jgi:hypothetical protein|nr:MAG: hypothetical protein JETCAE03_36170 [Ignavibacteriaceae bacterium]
MIPTDLKHINEDGQILEGDVLKFNNSDKVFFVVEKVIMVPNITEDDTIINEEYVARKLDGNVLEQLSYNSNNETKRFSFPSGNAPMKIDHAFVVGKMFKNFI